MSKKRLPIFQKVSNLLKIFIFIAKVRKLSFGKHSIGHWKPQNSKKLKFVEHYNYGFLGEYEFSPSNTSFPLIHHHRKQFRKSTIHRDMYSLFLLCKCWGRFRVEEEDVFGDFTVEALPAANGERNDVALLEPLDWGDKIEDASIDLRAQMFIDRFYEEIRMQRQKSL